MPPHFNNATARPRRLSEYDAVVLHGRMRAAATSRLRFGRRTVALPVMVVLDGDESEVGFSQGARVETPSEGQTGVQVEAGRQSRETSKGPDPERHRSTPIRDAGDLLSGLQPPSYVSTRKWTSGHCSLTRFLSSIRTVERTLQFTININSEHERTIEYRCSKSKGDAPLDTAPIVAESRSPSDVHFHIHNGEVQYWVVTMRRNWAKWKLGGEHPRSSSRVLSHRSPWAAKFPNWVLSTTWKTYKARDRQKKEQGRLDTLDFLD